MKIKIYLMLVILLSVNFNLDAKVFISNLNDDIEINQEIVTYKNNVVAKFETQEQKSGDAKTKIVNVSIFSKKGKLIALYDIELLNKASKNKDAILSASIKTTKDKVIHSGTNFLDFHVKQKNEDQAKLIQLDQVIKYLMSYHYL